MSNIPPLPTDAGLEISQDDRNMAALIHVLGLFSGFVGPLIIWLIKRESSPFIDDQGKEALNYHITFVLIWLIIMGLAIATCGFGAVLAVPAIILFWVFTIQATLASSKGIRYRYPYCMRILK